MGDVEDDVMAEISITEIQNASNADKKNGRIIYPVGDICVNESRNRRNIVDLAKPVFIKPGISYKISYYFSDGCDPYTCTTFRMISDRVQINSEIKVEFTDENDGRALLYGLYFNAV